MTEKTIVLIDFSNIDFAFQIIKERGGFSPRAKLDYEKFIHTITLGRNIVTKTIYIGTRTCIDGFQGFLNFFKKLGFRVITKEKKVIHLDNGGTKNKANFDVEIAVDACAHIWKRECNEIILVSGDSDFAYLIEKAKEFGLKVTIVSSNATLSTELRNNADNLILIDKIGIENYILNK